MPRIYGDYVMIAALDDDLGQVAGDLVKKADDLDVSIGEAAQNFDKRACERLKLLRSQAEQFADDVSTNLAAAMRKKRLIV